ncbi:FAD binding domain-containing protein [Sarocladium implicatum]|nr:FAD binding domain-containing protein [Sarocladium implicatum]
MASNISMAAQTPRVAIVGAGLTGLLTAHGLQKNGIGVTIYERDESLNARARDWTILLHWALPLLDKLVPADLLAKLPYAVCNPHLDFNEDIECLPVYNGATGALLFKSPTPGARRISRQRLREILIEGLDIKWGCLVKNIDASDQKVNLELDDNGDPQEFEFVVGADGAASKVRELLLGVDKARPLGSGFIFSTGTAKYGELEKRRRQVFPMRFRSPVFVFRAEDPAKQDEWETFWNNLEGLSGVFKDAIEWTSEGSPCWINEMRYWLAEPWDNKNGRVTLLGDAAHPMLIFRGQGMQHAVSDAVSYVEALVKILSSDTETIDRGQVMSEFEKDMIERGNAAVKQSLEEAEKALDSEKVGKMLMATKGHVKS